MSEVTVLIIESERGWGQRVEDILRFDDYNSALKYVKEYNNKYNPPTNTTPDWYMYAKIEGEWGIKR